MQLFSTYELAQVFVSRFLYIPSVGPKTAISRSLLWEHRSRAEEIITNTLTQPGKLFLIIVSSYQCRCTSYVDSDFHLSSMPLFLCKAKTDIRAWLAIMYLMFACSNLCPNQENVDMIFLYWSLSSNNGSADLFSF